MASNHTPQYGLNQWLSSDTVLRTDFNQDNTKLEAALLALADGTQTLNSNVQTMSGEIQTLSNGLQELSGRVQALETLPDNVQSLTARVQSLETLPGQIQTLTDRVKASTYVGTGKYGSNNKNSVTFPARPKAVFVSGPNSAVFPGTAASGFVNSDGYDMIPFSWSGNTLSWYNAQDPAYHLNENGVTYTCLALYL